jgi:uncharacterized membrane protein YheB (UPF0754 family)
MNISLWLAIPIISALIGYGTNYLAVKMIFRPSKPYSLFGYTVQGLLPKRQKEIAASIARMIDRDLISHRDVQDALRRPEVISSARQVMSEEFDSMIAKLGQKNPVLAMFLQGEVLAQVKEVLLSQMDSVAPRFMDRVAERIEGSLDFRQIVQTKIEGFQLETLEGLVYEISSSELRAIEILGGVLGFVIGVFQVMLMGL